NDTVKVSVKATDDVGISRVRLYYKTPITNKSVYVSMNYNPSTGMYEGSIPIQSNSESGTYKVSYVTIYDTSENQISVWDWDDPDNKLQAGNFFVFTESNLPTYKSLSIDKNVVESGDQVNISVDASDDTNLKEATIHYLSPVNKTKVSIPLHYDGTRFIGQMPVEQTTEVGKWIVDSIEIKDTNGNVTTVKAEDNDLSAGQFNVIKSVDPLTSHIVTNNESWSNKTVNSDVYIVPGAVLTINSNVTINGNVYVLGGLRSYGGLQVNGILTANSMYFGYYYPSDGQAIFTGSNSISSMIATNRVLTNVPFNLYNTPLISNNGKVNLSGATLPFVNLKINGQNIALKSNGTFRYNDFDIGDSEQLNVEITDISGGKYTYTYKVAEIFIDDFTKDSKTITGTTLANSIVKILQDGVLIGSGTSNEDGKYEIPVNNLIENNTVTFNVYNTNNELIASKDIKVKDITPPAKPVVNEVSDQSETVTGTSETNSKVTVINGSSKYTGTANENGKFNITIPKQKAGTTLTVYAEDASGNRSAETSVTVSDKTAPTKPSVNSVSDQDTSVGGTAEAGAKVIVKKGSEVLESSTANDNGTFKVTIAKQKAGTTLTVYAEDASGNKSDEVQIQVSDKTAPTKPSVNSVSDQDTSVGGTAESGAKVTVKKGSEVLGSSTAVENGMFKVTIAKQKAGTTLTVYAEDTSGNKSDEVQIQVSDKMAPTKPSVNSVSDQDTSVGGTAESGAKITVKKGSEVLGSSTANDQGSFKVTIPKQKAGTTLTVYAEDASGNKSDEVQIQVSDKTAPTKPTIYTMGDNQTTISGKAEVGSTITVKSGNSVIGHATTSSKGTFTVKLKSKHKAGTTLVAYATDKSKNQSSGTTFKVVDKTAPSKPTIYTMGDNQTTISGKAEVGSIITIKSGNSVIGYTTTSSKGTFTVKLKSKHKAGTTLVAYATDKSKNQSSGTTFKVVDKTAPGTPTINKVTYKSTTVTGKAEKGATVYLYNGSKYLGKATVNSKGTYSIKIKKQKKNSTLKVLVKDKAGNKSKYRSIKVQ
ncbi:Ig-like domain-containing protein, partial [Terrilactibacillus laevilacticus]